MTPRSRTLLAVASTVNLLQTLLFPVLAVRALGPGMAVDALFTVFILPAMVSALLGNSVLNWLAPRLVARIDPGARRTLCWSMLWFLLFALTAVFVLLAVLANGLVAGRPAADTYRVAVGLLPVAYVAVVATVSGALANLLYTAERDVPGAEVRTLLGNSVALLAWFFCMPATLAACAALFALRPLLVTFALLPRLGKPRLPDRHDRDLREVLRDSRVLLLAAGYYKSEPLFDRLLLAGASGGAVAALHLASQVLGIVGQVAQRVFVAPMVAPFAEAVQEANPGAMRRIIREAFVRMLAVGLAAWVLLAVGGEPLLRLLFINGQADDAHLALTAQMLVLLGGGALAGMLGLVSAQVYYCAQERRRVVVYSCATSTVNMIAKALAFWQFGIPGLVVSASITSLAGVAFFYARVPAIIRRVARGEPPPPAL